MYKNPGRALKTLAYIGCILEMLACIAAGALIIVISCNVAVPVSIPIPGELAALGVSYTKEMAISVGVGIILVGCFLAWLLNLGLAAIGELIKNSTEIKNLLKQQVALSKEAAEAAAKAAEAPTTAPAAEPAAAPAEEPVVPQFITVAPAETAAPEEIVVLGPEEVPAAEPEIVISTVETPVVEEPAAPVQPVVDPAPKTAVCKVCGAAIRPGVRFCTQCGTSQD